MTKHFLRELLTMGYSLEDLLPIGPGQDCDYFQTRYFKPGESILYIPDMELNEIRYDARNLSKEEIEHIISQCYTGDDFINECDGDTKMAERLFWYVDWQHPCSAVDELDDEEG